MSYTFNNEPLLSNEFYYLIFFHIYITKKLLYTFFLLLYFFVCNTPLTPLHWFTTLIYYVIELDLESGLCRRWCDPDLAHRYHIYILSLYMCNIYANIKI